MVHIYLTFPIDKQGLRAYIIDRGDKMRASYKPTKLDKARQVVCALWDMEELPTESNTARWREVKKFARKDMATLDNLYEKAYKILIERHG